MGKNPLHGKPKLSLVINPILQHNGPELRPMLIYEHQSWHGKLRFLLVARQEYGFAYVIAL